LFGTVSCDKGEIFQYKTDTFIKDWLLYGPFPNCENCSSTDFIHGEDCHGFYTDYPSYGHILLPLDGFMRTEYE